jgi:ATP-dependent exoDNAse (exonuclease V) beta subunit
VGRALCPLVPAPSPARAGLLRSPAFALSDVALYRLCQGRDQAAGCTSLWEALEQAGTWLDGEAAQRAERAARTIAALHARAGRVSAADLLKAFLDETGYRAALIQAGEARGARNVAKLLADAHASGIVGVGEFLEYVAGLRDSGTREGEARATAEGAVQIMSVHAAKGLEFPVVAIGDVTYGRHGGNGALIDPELGVLLPLQGEEGALAAIYRLGKARADDQEAAELDRLFYVAATRAGEKLILNGCIALKRDGTPARLGGWLGQIAGPLGLAGTPIACDQEGGSRAIHLHLQAGQVPVACTIYEPGHAWDLPSRRAAEEPGPAASLSPPLLTPVAAVEEQVDERTAQRERVPPRRVWRVVPAAAEAHVPSRVLGSLVHEALAAWRFPDQGYNRWAEARARGYGLADPRQLADAVRRSRQLLARFRGHPLCREMEEAESLLHEVPYSLVVDAGAAGVESDLLESGIVDALYLRGGAWTIVEFKTDYVQDEAGLEQLLEREDYLAQTARYVRAVERLLGQRPRAILCLLNYARRAIRTLAIGSTGQRASS